MKEESYYRSLSMKSCNVSSFYCVFTFIRCYNGLFNSFDYLKPFYTVLFFITSIQFSLTCVDANPVHLTLLFSGGFVAEKKIYQNIYLYFIGPWSLLEYSTTSTTFLASLLSPARLFNFLLESPKICSVFFNSQTSSKIPLDPSIFQF